MSLFSRLEERMRARDSQDDSKDKIAKSEPVKGGLFGSIQLGPVKEASSVPPPSTSVAETEFPATTDARDVPSVEEARAEFDRARAEFASGLFRRDPDANSDKSDDTPLAETAPASFGAVALPPVVETQAPKFDAPIEMPPSQLIVSAPVSEQPSILPSQIDAEIAAPAIQPPATESGVVPDETVVYAPTPPTEPQVIARSEPHVGETHNLVPTMENLRTAEMEYSPLGTPEMSVMETPKIEDKPMPVVRSGANSNLTPFQRLMAARAAQGGPPVSRPRVERSTPVVIQEPVIETPVLETPVLETPKAEMPHIHVPVINAPEVQLPEVDLPQIDVPVSSTPKVEIPEVEMPKVSSSEIELPHIQSPEVNVPKVEMPTVSLPKVEMPDVSAPKVEMPPTEAPNINAPKIDSPEIDLPNVQLPVVESPIVEAPTSRFGQIDLPAQVAAPQIEVPTVEIPSVTVSHVEIPHVELTKVDVPHDEIPQASIEDTRGQIHLATEDEILAHNEANLTIENPVAETVIEEPAEEVTQVPVGVAAVSEPEPMVETPPVEPSRMAVPVSFAERLAARKRLLETTDEAATDNALVAASPAVAEVELPPTPMNFAPPPAPNEAPQRPATRSFSERLAARTGLDRNLQAPVEEVATPQDLAKQSAELARIDQNVELSEREMKNRVLFRQKNLIFDSVVGSLDQRALQNPTREIVKPQIERAVDSSLREFEMTLEPVDRNWMVDEFVRETTDLGALVPMLEDPSVSKITVTGANDVSVERLGRVERTGISFRDDDHLLSIVRRMAEMSGGRVDAKVPLLDRPLPDGGRIRAKVPPLAPLPTLTIEKSTGNPFVALKRQMEDKSRNDALPYAQLRERIQQRLLREFEGDAAALGGDPEKLRHQVEEMIGVVIAEERVAVTRAERASLVMDLLNEIVGLGPIEPLLNDPDIDEVMVNGPYQIYVERKGKLELSNQRFRDNAHVMQVIDRIVAPLGRRVDEKSPMVDGRLRDGSRFNAIIPPLALGGPTMTIRKFARDPFTMSDLINFGSMTREAAQFLQAAVEGRLNIVVSGGTGSGKTTTLNVLSSFIPSSERIVTIEDAAELQMRQEHVIRMETRPPNIEGAGEVGIRDLVRNSLRMRPDRIVVGECRGGEALDMLQAMNTGHDGSLTTAHSNGPRDTCKRLETMVMMAGFDLPVRAIREQISMAIQLIVHQERMRDGKRRVTAITEIVGMEGDVLTLQDIFRFEQEGMDDEGRILGSLQATGMRPKYYETIIDNGVQLSMELFAPKPHEAAPRARLTSR